MGADLSKVEDQARQVARITYLYYIYLLLLYSSKF